MKKYCYDLVLCVCSIKFSRKKSDILPNEMKLIQTTDFSQPDACNSSFKINCTATTTTTTTSNQFTEDGTFFSLIIYGYLF